MKAVSCGDSLHSDIYVTDDFKNYKSEFVNLAEAFAATVNRVPDNPFVGSSQDGNMVWITYGEADTMIDNLGSQLLSRGMVKHKPFPEEASTFATVGIYCSNCPAWFIVDQTCSRFGLTLVPLYDTLGRDASVFILNQAQIDTLFVSAATLSSALKLVQQSGCRELVCVDDIPAESRAAAEQAGVKIYSISELWQERAEVTRPEVSSDTVCTLCYTSGTTGDPKGVKLTHRNLLSCVEGMFGVLESIPEHIHVDSSMTHFSYLPLPHVLERIVVGAFWMIGGRIVCFSGNKPRLLQELAEAQPDFFVAVPRVLAKIADAVEKAVSEMSFPVRYVFDWSLQRKEDNLINQGRRTSTLIDALIFRRFRSLLGGKVKFIVVGGAPLDPELWKRIQALFGVPVMQGYGLSECCGVCFVQTPTARECNAGSVMPGLECRLASVPEMEYDATGPTPAGEVLIRGPTVFSGYFCNKEAAKENLNEEGWLHTGDIGRLQSGCLELVDRRKAIFKLSQGEYISPEKIESVYTHAPSVKQIFVYGSRVADYLVAIVVVSKRKKEEFESLEELESTIRRELDGAAEKAGLKGFERVRKIHITDESFTVDNHLLTPTEKIRRHEVEKKYHLEINDLYSK